MSVLSAVAAAVLCLTYCDPGRDGLRASFDVSVGVLNSGWVFCLPVWMRYLLYWWYLETAHPSMLADWPICDERCAELGFERFRGWSVGRRHLHRTVVAFWRIPLPGTIFPPFWTGYLPSSIYNRGTQCPHRARPFRNLPICRGTFPLFCWNVRATLSCVFVSSVRAPLRFPSSFFGKK